MFTFPLTAALVPPGLYLPWLGISAVVFGKEKCDRAVRHVRGRSAHPLKWCSLLAFQPGRWEKHRAVLRMVKITSGLICLWRKSDMLDVSWNTSYIPNCFAWRVPG